MTTFRSTFRLRCTGSHKLFWEFFFLFISVLFKFQAEQLIPAVAYGAQGEQEVLEGLPSEPPRSNIDSMIQALEIRQFGGQSNSRQHASNANRPASWRNDNEGVRFSSGNWEGTGSCMTWKAKTLLKEMPPSTIEQTRLKL